MPKKRHRLTPREIEALSAFGNGHTTESAAALLQIGKRTVEDHVQRACAKLGAKNRTHAVALAVQAGLVTLEPESSAGPKSIAEEAQDDGESDLPEGG